MSRPPSCLLALTTLVGAALLAVPHASARELTKPFQIASGDAIETLKFFVHQSSEQVVYPPQEVHGVKTNAVNGQLTPLAALRQMLSGTALSVLYDERTGALAIKRDSDPNGRRPAQKKAKSDRPNPNEAAQNNARNSLASSSHSLPTPNNSPMKQPSSIRRFLALGAAIAASLSASAQNAPTRNNESRADREEAVALDAFEVVMTQDKGYHVPYSGSGALKTNEDIMKIPQSVTVITRDLIDDLSNGIGLSDILNYIGVSNFQQGESAYVRGNAAPILTDGASDGNFDTASIDSITVVRGPIGVLYGGNSSLTGAVVRQTRVPLANRRTEVKLKVDEWGFYRADIDHTGPLGEIGAAKYSYRVDLAYQDGGDFLRGIRRQRQVYFGVLQMKYKDTTLRLGAQFQLAVQPPHVSTGSIPVGNPAAPEAVPFTLAGRDFTFMNKDSMLKSKSTIVRLNWLQRFSPNWSLASYGTMSFFRYGPKAVLLLDRLNYQTQTARLMARRNNSGSESFTAGSDLNGIYNVLGRQMRTSLGFTARNVRTNINDFVANPNFGSQNASLGTPAKSAATLTTFDRLDIPFANVRQAMDGIYNMPAELYPITPTQTLGTRSETTETNAYFQQNVEVIPNRLILMGAVSAIQNNGISATYTASKVATSTATESRNRRFLHRYGLVLNVTKNIALYAVETTMVAFINSTSRTADGKFLPPRDGIMKEAGVKTTLWDGRLTATASIYDNHFKNWPVSTGLTDPVLNFLIFKLIDDSYIKGWDFSIAAKPLPNWQLLVNYTEQDPRVQATNTRLSSSNLGGWGVVSTYQFTSDALKKFRIGGGANRTHGRITPSGNIVLADGTLASSLPGNSSSILLKDGTMSFAFVEYKPNRHWSFTLNVNNVLDETFVVGAQSAVTIDPSQPRTFSLISTYRF